MIKTVQDPPDAPPKVFQYSKLSYRWPYLYYAPVTKFTKASATGKSEAPPQRIQITGCSRPDYWYCNLVGQTVLFLGYASDKKTEYLTRDREGFLNFVQHNDAVLVDQIKVN